MDHRPFIGHPVALFVGPIRAYEHGVVTCFFLAGIGALAVVAGAENGFGSYAPRPAWLTPLVAVALLVTCLYGPALDAAVSTRRRVTLSMPMGWPGRSAVTWTTACAVFIVLESRLLLAVWPDLPHDHAGVAQAVLLGLNVGVTEELLFRVLVLGALIRAASVVTAPDATRSMAVLACIASSTIAFAALHVVSGRYASAGELWVQYLFGGAALGTVYVRVGTFAAVAAHAGAAMILLLI